jgi:hypothetical protein
MASALFDPRPTAAVRSAPTHRLARLLIRASGSQPCSTRWRSRGGLWAMAGLSRAGLWLVSGWVACALSKTGFHGD